jgi:hypothetical protein
VTKVTARPAVRRSVAGDIDRRLYGRPEKIAAAFGALAGLGLAEIETRRAAPARRPPHRPGRRRARRPADHADRDRVIHGEPFAAGDSSTIAGIGGLLCSVLADTAMRDALVADPSVYLCWAAAEPGRGRVP